MVLVPKTSASAIPPRMRTSDRIRTYIYNSVTINRLEGGLDYRGIYFSSSYGSRTHIVGLEDQCPIQLNEGTICRQGGIRTHVFNIPATVLHLIRMGWYMPFLFHNVSLYDN